MPLILSSIGIACFILLIHQLFYIYQSKVKAKQILTEKIKKYDNNPNAVREPLFTENIIRFSEPDMLLEFQWNIFSHYKEHVNFVYFYLEENKNPTIGMDKNNVPASIAKGLFELINTKIVVKL